MPPVSADWDGDAIVKDEDLRRPDLKAARAARFTRQLIGNRFRELEAVRNQQRQALEQQGLINIGQTELDAAIELRGTCEQMCSEFEIESREFKQDVDYFELMPGSSAGAERRIDHSRAVAKYSRSDAGAGHGEAAALPSDFRTPYALVRTVDYLFSEIMLQPLPPPPANPSNLSVYTERRALGSSSGFIRDRTRAVRKEFAMQSSWGHDEAIACTERIARWHILCLRELQEETGKNTDMHIDSAELGRCFTSLAQNYNDRREELGVELPCPNEPEFRAYMLIFDLNNKSTSILVSELPDQVFNHPLVRLAWEIRNAAQRNFDSQKEASKGNAEYGTNSISRFVRLLKQTKVPYLLSCLVEVRLREIRRSTLRSLTRAYARLRDARVNDNGANVDTRMFLFNVLDTILGCEGQEMDQPAWEEVAPAVVDPKDEAFEAVKRFGIETLTEQGEPIGAFINIGAPFNDNRDAPFVRRWNVITERKSSLSFADIVNGKAGVHINQSRATAPLPMQSSPIHTDTKAAFSSARKQTAIEIAGPPPPRPDGSAFSFSLNPKPSLTTPLPTEQADATTTMRPTFLGATIPLLKPASQLGPPSVPLPTFSFTAPTPRINPAPVSTPLFSSEPFTFLPSRTQGSPTHTPPVTPLSVSSNPLPVSILPSLAQSGDMTVASSSKPAAPSPLSTSISRQPTVTNADRLKRQHAIPFIYDMLLQEILDEVTESLGPDLLKAIRQGNAERLYAEAKRLRRHQIDKYSQLTFATALERHIEDMARWTVLEEMRKRTLVRSSIRQWRSWMQRQRRARDHATKEREDTCLRLQHLGLSSDTVMATGAEKAEEVDKSKPNHRLDEIEIDVGLQQAERSKDHFLAPSTFLFAIARHIGFLSQTKNHVTASLRLNINELPPAQWHNIISTSQDSEISPTEGAGDWLSSKFSPALPSETSYERDGVTFRSSFVGRFDDMPSSADVGLAVFEAPGSTWDSRKKAENAADAQDRMATLAKLADNPENQYKPALLLLSWEGESLSDLVRRLDIRDDVAFFDKVAVLSLEYGGDLDEHFETSLREIIPEIPQKYQISIRLQDVLAALLPSWQHYLRVVTLSISQRPCDGKLAAFALAIGLDLIAQLSHCARLPLGKAGLDKASTFSPITLPSFDSSNLQTPLAVSEEIITLIHDPAFAQVDDLSLYVGQLRRAAMNGHLASILEAMAFFAFGELASQIMVLRRWQAQPDTRPCVDDYLAATRKAYEVHTEQVIQELSRLVKMPTSAKASPRNDISVPHPYSSSSPLTPSKARSHINKKRARPSVASTPSRTALEIKLSKRSKLLRALEAANKTLSVVESDLEGLDALFA